MMYQELFLWGKKYVIRRGEKVVKLIQQLLYYIPLTFVWQLCAAMMSWVGCLLTDYMLPDKWK